MKRLPVPPGRPLSQRRSSLGARSRSGEGQDSGRGVGISTYARAREQIACRGLGGHGARRYERSEWPRDAGRESLAQRKSFL